jgi:hypothetical protein
MAAATAEPSPPATRVTTRLRAVEQAYRTAIDHDTAFEPAAPTRAFRTPDHAADGEIELE